MHTLFMITNFSRTIINCWALKIATGRQHFVYLCRFCWHKCNIICTYLKVLFRVQDVRVKLKCIEMAQVFLLPNVWNVANILCTYKFNDYQFRFFFLQYLKVQTYELIDAS